MNSGQTKKIVKKINVDINKCTGCRSCEMACSAFHAVPKYSSLNPARSRIRVYMDEVRDIYVPVRAGHYTQAECNGRNLYLIGDKEYAECTFCHASCPSRGHFKDPDSGLPLKCDMCEDTPPIPEPMCVQVCRFDALTYEEREEDVTEDEQEEINEITELDTALESMAQRHGLKRVIESFARLSQR